MKFQTTKEMLEEIKKHDLYCPSEGIYVFLYNDYDSIAYYRLTQDEAAELAIEAKAANEYWGALLGPGGYIVDDPSYPDFQDGNMSNLDWCEEYKDLDWIPTEIYTVDYIVSKLNNFMEFDHKFWEEEFGCEFDDIVNLYGFGYDINNQLGYISVDSYTEIPISPETILDKIQSAYKEDNDSLRIEQMRNIIFWIYKESEK